LEADVDEGVTGTEEDWEEIPAEANEAGRQDGQVGEAGEVGQVQSQEGRRDAVGDPALLSASMIGVDVSSPTDNLSSLSGASDSPVPTQQTTQTTADTTADDAASAPIPISTPRRSDTDRLNNPSPTSANGEGPMTPTNDVGPFVFDGRAGARSGTRGSRNRSRNVAGVMGLGSAAAEGGEGAGGADGGEDGERM
jgi:hypothetical protein